jgi:regulator of sigma E protease
MDFLQAISPLAIFTGIVSLLLALIVIVFIHELGHFLVARWCGVRIDAFAVGFGRELFGFNDRHGTRWKICLWPLGGYVKFHGDANAASKPNLEEGHVHPADSLHGQHVAKRMAIVAAGPLANFILAIALWAGLYMFVGHSYRLPIVGSVLAGSAAEAAGLLPGDTILAIDGRAVDSFDSIPRMVILRGGEELAVKIERAGITKNFNIVPRVVESKDDFGGTMRLGVLGIQSSKDPSHVSHERLGIVASISKAADQTWHTASMTLKFLGKVITGQQSAKQIGGAVTMGKGASDAVSAGFEQFVYYIGFLSISVGIVNLFPIPMLDGGHLVFYTIEALRGKPLGPVAQEWGYRIGISCVVMLMLFGLFNDMGRVVNVVFGT